MTFSATRRFSGLIATPWPFSFATSSRKACGSNTTPLPITASFCGRSTPEGSSAQLVGLTVDDEGVAGIVAALEAHDDVGLLRQPVDDLALPLVAPLGADDDNIGHCESVPYNSERFDHDRDRERVPIDPGSCFAYPAEITAQGRSHAGP